MHRELFLGLLMVAIAVNGLAAEPVLIQNGFGTGEEYLKMSPLEQRAYAMGIVNGMLLAPLFGAPKDRMFRFESCVTGMTDSQVAAILTKYLRDNPGRWHETPHAPMYTALMKACP
jgi:hypothetical protein